VFYAPIPKDHYEWINAIEPADYETFLSFDGSRRAATWTPIKVRRVRADNHHACRASDFPWLGSQVLIMRQRAIDSLRGLFEAHGEILPLTTDDDSHLFALNVTTVLDALDEERSAIRRIPGTQKIMQIKNAVFRTSRVEGVDIFRLPHRASGTYVSDRFVDAYGKAGLVGLEFRPQE
jgi:hypothetical protein